MGFMDAESQKPAQVMELSEDDVADGKCIDTKFVRFQNVSNISIFVERSHDAETTIINRISIVGAPIAGTNMSDLKKVG